MNRANSQKRKEDLDKKMEKKIFWLFGLFRYKMILRGPSSWAGLIVDDNMNFWVSGFIGQISLYNQFYTFTIGQSLSKTYISFVWHHGEGRH